jgi:hypothetical protein
MSSQDKKAGDNNLKVLYLDREKLDFIQIQIENNMTCDSIIKNNRDILKDKIEPIYKKPIEDFNFLFIENKPNVKKEEIPSLMEFRVNKRTKIFNLIQNPQYNLYFLPKKKSNISDRKKAREGNNEPQNFFEDAETNYFSNKSSEEYINKQSFYFYDSIKQEFNKEKGSVDKNKITIFKSSKIKDNIEIYIKDIIKDLYYPENSPAPYRKNLPIKGDRPKFYIEITTHKTTYFLAQFKDSYQFQWENAIKTAITNYKNYNIDLNLNIKIASSKTSIYATHHSIINNCFVINKILFNEEKRKIFFSNFSDKKISAITYNILMYKDLIKKNKYLESWMRFKEILTYIDSYYINNEINENRIITEDNKINSIFTTNRINKYNKISEDANESVKKIKIEESSLNLFQNEIKNALCDILKDDLFDDMFYYLYKLYIIPYFDEIKKLLRKGSIPDEKPLIRKKFQFLLAIYLYKILKVTINNFYLICPKINSDDKNVINENIPQNV